MNLTAMGWGTWFRCAILLALGLLVCLAVCAARKGNSLFEWQASLLATEFGHFLAVIALGTTFGFLWADFSRVSVRMIGAGLSLGLALWFLRPAWEASRITVSFSQSRLWCPWMGPDTESVSVERHVIEGRDPDGTPDLEMIVCRPPGSQKTDAALPWIVGVHGGGWNGGEPGEFLAWDRELASHGFVVFLPSYRLAPDHQWPAPREDLVEVVRWVRERADEFGIDPGDLTLLGRSAGGQIATATAFGVADLEVKRCIAFYAPHDMFFARRYAREDDVLDSRKLLRDYLGGDPGENEGRYRSASAIELVTPEVPPTLLIHGIPDSLVWVEQSRRLASRMEEVGAAVKFVELPWATHACDYFPFTPGGQVAMDQTMRWLRSEE